MKRSENCVKALCHPCHLYHEWLSFVISLPTRKWGMKKWEDLLKARATLVIFVFVV